MLEDLTYDDFAHRVGEPVRIRLDSGESLEAKLVASTDLGPARGPTAKTPFSLEFVGPSEPVLPQRIYRFEHEELGPFEIFIVPIGRDEAGTTYEAVFA